MQKGVQTDATSNNVASGCTGLSFFVGSLDLGYDQPLYLLCTLVNECDTNSVPESCTITEKFCKNK